MAFTLAICSGCFGGLGAWACPFSTPTTPKRWPSHSHTNNTRLEDPITQLTYANTQHTNNTRLEDPITQLIDAQTYQTGLTFFFENMLYHKVVHLFHIVVVILSKS